MSDIAEINTLVRRVQDRVGDVSVDVREAREVPDLYVVEFANQLEMSVEVIMAPEAAFSKVLIGRYIFEVVPLDDLAEAVALLLEGRLKLRKKHFPLRLLCLTVEVEGRSYRAFGPRSGHFESWEVSALSG